MRSALFLAVSGAIASHTTAGSMSADNICSLHGTDEASDGDCVQWDMNCQTIEYAKEGESRMSDGTCTSVGFSVKGDSSTVTSPWTGDIVITMYTRAVYPSMDSICSLYGMDETSNGGCVQWDMDCQVIEYAKEGESRMSNGTCASVGFRVKGNSSTETSPWTGDINVTTYTRAVYPSVDSICSLYGIDEASNGGCVQWDMDCQVIEYAKEGESRMSDGTCAFVGFGVKGNSSTETSPWTGVINITTYTAAGLHGDAAAIGNIVVV